MGAADAVTGPIVFFDGVCNLCNASVLFIIDHNPQNNIRFSPLQSRFASDCLSQNPGDGFSSIVLMDKEGLHTRSTAALRIVRELRFPFSLLYGLIVVPRIVRDPVYDWIARHRYRWFGKRSSCRMPTPELAARFIDSPILS